MENSSFEECGRAWVFGDDIDTDALAPGTYLKGSVEELSKHCLEVVSPTFATKVRPGDVVVGGMNFGIGSSREQAAQALKLLGVEAVIAGSFGGIFQRNALNLGLPALVCDSAGRIRHGDHVRVDAKTGRVENLTRDETYDCESLPGHLLAMIADGGLIPHLEKRLTSALPGKGRQ